MTAFLLGCGSSLTPEEIADKAPKACKNICDDFVDCEFKTSQGKLVDDASDGAKKACYAVCYWAAEEGTYGYSDDGYGKSFEVKVSGSAIKEYIKCLDDNRLYTCKNNSFFIDASSMNLLSCVSLDQCINILEIDLKTKWIDYKNGYTECALTGSQNIWPDILGLYWDNY